ncbi:MAG: hypothetical protein HY646_05935 [Acidobacteria bacterium]|nr:hypothetical protein [Acidobacteriota bacterium]
MRIRKHHALFVLLSLILITDNCLASAWTLRKDRYYFEFYSQYFRSTRDFNAVGLRVPKPNTGKFQEIRGEMKIEAGLPSSRINLLLHVPVEWAWYTDRNVKLHTRGLEEVRVGAKYRFTDETSPIVAAVQFLAKIPGCDSKASPPLADCQFDSDGRIILSRGFAGEKTTGVSRTFVSGELGYRSRLKDPADEIPYFLEAGWNAGGRWWLKGTVDGVASRPASTTGSEEDFAKWTAGIVYSKDPSERRENAFTFEVGYGEVFSGKNTGIGRPILFAKFAYQFGRP